MTNEVFGRPIKGDINHYTGALPEQEDPAKFIEALDKLLDHPQVAKVRWTQYTPYFNDGEACEFETHGAEVSLVNLTTADTGLEVGEDRWYDEGEEVFLGEYDMYTYEYGDDGRIDWDKGKRYVVGGVDTEDVAVALAQFEMALNSKHYVWLNETFGDPAEVTATKEGFMVEHYEHD
ncbi:hypothetical protein SEA_PARADIDDLES_125 [Streptomyces phage Paradiddles]|uniref:Uncharacterized protein n=1 Tax=Streptomyces phage Paradiddles TaxID=2023993 RepID=A0A222Z219_9CAUD|nr:hypothetical protein FDI37_gp135 [Streptomyces phage Paradiddles]ASR77595.1 hypothetical protein SEA_PARADIDDLES_125 [Streptomyces phage Paradiddles]UOW93551.1 hypothetical protein SEA_SQUILLIUM_129 [Streptomyces phage Squillium]WNM73383.1 hypothetical protein SEA_LIANDRY_129 [Streptomyces phage Liandry]WNM74781.1 hypothetical protein SEA_PINKIEPIE_126 [Streptomyces phage PinkiePie]